jgi:hypothetical protein
MQRELIESGPTSRMPLSEGRAHANVVHCIAPRSPQEDGAFSKLSDPTYDLPAHTKAALRRAGVKQIVSFP